MRSPHDPRLVPDRACADAVRRRPAGAGEAVRRPAAGAALRALAEAVAAFGNGVVELTGRGNLQLRGVRDAPAFARAMVAAGLADPDPAREARRNVVAVPPCDDALVAEAEALLAGTAGLPAKFCVVVAGCRVFLDGEPTASLREALAQPSTGGRYKAPPVPDELGGHLLHLPFGQTDSAGLVRLADAAPGIRTTPWRAFLRPSRSPGFAAAPATIAACPGAPACSSATVPARADAARLAAAGSASSTSPAAPRAARIPRAGTTLVGRDGRYDLVRHGRAEACRTTVA